MRNYTKKFLVMLLVSLMATALSACAGGKAGSADADSLITIGIPQDLDDSLDPHIAEGAGTRGYYLMYLKVW